MRSLYCDFSICRFFVTKLLFYHLCEVNSFFFVYCGAIVDIQMNRYVCALGNDKADEESFDSSPAFLIAIYLQSLQEYSGTVRSFITDS